MFCDTTYRVIFSSKRVSIDDLPSVPPKREIDFSIDILLDTRAISIPPCRIAPKELEDLKELLKDL